MIDFPNIPENHFLEHNRTQLQKLAQDLRATGLSMNRISELTRMNWDTVYKAMNERPVRFDNAERLRYFIQWWKEHQGELPENRKTKPATPPEVKADPVPELTKNSPTTQQPQPATPPRGKGGKFTKKNPETK